MDNRHNADEIGVEVLTLAICLEDLFFISPTAADRKLAKDIASELETIELPCDDNKAWQAYYAAFTNNAGFPLNCFPIDLEKYPSRLHFDVEMIKKGWSSKSDNSAREETIKVEKYKHLGGITPRFWINKSWKVLEENLTSRNEQAILNITDKFIFEISFGKSTSKNYNKALNLAVKSLKVIELAEDTDGINRFILPSFKEYLEMHETVIALVNLVRRLKSFSVSVNNKTMKAPKFFWLDNLLCSHAGDLKWLLNKENLPLQHVIYPSKGHQPFFLYSEEPGKKAYLCECDEPKVNLFKEICRLNHCIIPVELEKANYLPNLCHRCNKAIPKRQYGHPMYYSKFMQKFGWYYDQNLALFGIAELSPYSIECLRSACPEEILPLIDDMLNIKKDEWESKENTYKEIKKYCENYTREEFGYPKIGEKWISETILFHIVQGLFSGYEVIFHARPKWLKGLELDIYIPKKNLAFEYQGIQHYQSVEHWGGEKKLLEQQSRDKAKRLMCLEHGITLIEWRYDQEITPEAVTAAVMSVEP